MYIGNLRSCYKISRDENHYFFFYFPNYYERELCPI